jgi:hypothetical protein
MNELQKHYEIVIEHDNPDKPNISVEAENGEIKVVFNGYRLFNTLAEKDTILVALNDKLSEILQKHLIKQANEETEIRHSR